MNIKQAKEEIKNTFLAYTRKRTSGEFCIPLAAQRPILLIGPPGIGKTAIVAQVAQELKTGFLSYTMTHHTRQSFCVSAGRIKTVSKLGILSG